MAAPAWAPTLAQVAVHIPTRTRETGADDLDDYAGTFTTATTPTAAEATELITQACTMVTAATGLPIAAAAEVQDACRLAAALWAAYWIELAYPERDADVAVYDQLRRVAESATKSAAALNTAAGGGATVDPTPEDSLTGSHTFPAAPPYADAPAGTIW